jgi:hypothetical protein
MARLMWIAISVTFGITKPVIVANLVGPWLRSFSHKQRASVGVAALFWRYGSVEMMLCSKNQNLNLFCR